MVQLTDAAGTVTQEYEYDAFGNEQNPDAEDTNPLRYCGEYFDAETGTIYLRARYYDPRIGRFTSADTVLQIMRKLGSGIEVPDLLSLNRYTYCHNNPVMYVDSSGNFAVAGSAVAVGAANGWNPVGWIILGTVIVVEIGVLTYNGIQYANEQSLAKAKAMMDFASSATTPPPPNDPNSKGTQTTSKTLYNKNGTRIDVENPGNRVGQIHVQQGDSKYIYDVAQKAFRTTTGELAPKSVQNLLTDPKIIKSIAKGLTYLGY